jgi:hypothetical protein
MLRYVFDTALQFRGHLHPAADSGWLFFPNPALDRKCGEVLPLEVELRQPQQQLMLRGTIHSRVSGTHPGLWIQFSDLRLARKLEANQDAIAQRKHHRVISDMVIEIREADASARIARLLDVSVGGARLGAANGLKAGMCVDIHLLTRMPDVPSDLGRATVVRAIGGEIGIRFPVEIAERVQKLVDASRRAWKAALTVTHNRGCCGPAGILDPPIPRLRVDKRLV